MTFLFLTLPFSSAWDSHSFLLLKKLAEVQEFCLVQISLVRVSWHTGFVCSVGNWGCSGDGREFLDQVLVSVSISECWD